MDDTLEKIDIIRKRTGATYARAKEVLDRAGGDVVLALAELEREGSSHTVLRVRPGELLRTLASLIRYGNASRIVIKSGDRVVADIPVTAGVALAVLAPWLTVLGTVAVLASPLTVYVERPPTS